MQKSSRVVQCQHVKQVTLVRLIPVVVQTRQSEDCHWTAWGFNIHLRHGLRVYLNSVTKRFVHK